MKIINNIKLKAWKHYISRESDTYGRKRSLLNINDTRSIGIHYDANDEEIYSKVDNLYKYFTSMNIKVNTLGYVKYKQIPHYCIPKLTFNYYKKNEINWYYKPQNNFVKEFTESEFDLLIDLDFSANYSGKYIVATSKAKTKVGVYNDDFQNFYDLMFSINEKELSIGEFIKQLIHYLSIINKR